MLTDAMIAKLWDESRGAFAFATEASMLIVRNVQAMTMRRPMPMR